MNKLRLLPLFIFVLLVGFVSSCKKDKDTVNGGTGNTDLQVYALDNEEEYVSGALVTLYTSKADRDAGSNVVQSATTGNNGFVYFSDLAPSKYYVTVYKKFGPGSVVSVDADTGVPIKQYEQTALTVTINEQ